MKKLIFLSLLAALSGSVAKAQNTFPPLGNTGIGTATPATLLQVQNGCVLFDGFTGSAPTIFPANNGMMWVPAKSAFRIGFVSGTQWDDVNIGVASFAGGYNSQAQGIGSMAYGVDAKTGTGISGGEACISLGYDTWASEHVSIAIGESTIATGGSGATAIGYRTEATGGASFAAGSNSIASGQNSVAIGRSSTSSNLYSMALGVYDANANGDYSIAMGSHASNNGRIGSFAYGDYDMSGFLPPVVNDNDYQFMVRARGGYKFFSDGGQTEAQAAYLKDGNVGIGVENMQAKLHVQDGAVLAEGTTGSTPMSGAGTRMMWVPDKAAFRAGYTTGSWDAAFIGNNSAATGNNSLASGDASFATGTNTLAAGTNAVASGFETKATGDNSFTSGENTEAANHNTAAFGSGSIASGENAFATGSSTTAVGSNSATFGANSNAAGDNSFAAGSSASTTADNAAAFGSGTTASGPSAFATGNNTQASNSNAFASGNGSQASGLHSVAMGNGNFSTGIASVSLGSNAGAMNDFTTAIGTTVRANAINSIAIGNNCTADGASSLALGTSSYAGTTQSVAIGVGATSTGAQATALGSGSSAQGAGSTAIGNGNNAQAVGNNSIAIGGNTIASANSIAINGNADNAGFTGSFLYSDMDANALQNSANNQFMARAIGGFVLQNSPTYTPLQTVTFDNGNLGVGTGTGGATDKLDVDGTVRIRNTPVNNTSTDILVRDANGVVNTRSITGLGSVGTDGWEAVTPPGTIPTNITQDIFRNGRVGLGTNNPDGRLHIVNPPCTNAPALHLTPTPSSPTVCGPGFPQGNLLEADDLTGATKVVINPNGAVGLGGTLNPLMLLDLSRGDMIFTGHPTNTYRMHYQYWLPNPELFISPTDASGNLLGAGIVMGTTGNVGIGINSSTTPGNRLQVNGNAVPASNCAFSLGTSSLRWNQIFLCTNPIIMSDARLKTNIQNSEYGIEEIKKLRPVTYNLTNSEGEGRQIGLIAQEAKEVIGEIVHVGDDADKMMGIKYSELIPVLITSIQQQQAMIDELKQQVAQLQSGNTNTTNTGGNNGNNTSTDDAVLNGVKLYQNIPNPFNVNTEIRYYLPEKVKQAMIAIYDLNGRQLRSYDIAQRGDGSVVVHGEELAPGMYLYSLVVEGREADTKRMVLSK